MTAARVVLLSFLLMASACERLQGPEKQFSRIEELLEAGDYNTAAITAHTLVQKNAADGRAQLALARAYRLQGNANSALAALEAGARAGADPAALAQVRAQVALDQGKAKELLAELDAAGSQLAQLQKLRFRARALLQLRRPIEALAIADGLLRAEPTAVEVLVIAAECHAMLGRSELAIQHVDRALAADPKAARAWILRATLMQGSDPKNARDALQHGIEFAPGQLGTHEQVAILAGAASRAISSQEIEPAAAAYSALIRLAPQAPLTRLIGAQIKMLRHENAEAVADLQRLAQDFPPARTTLIGALLVEGSYELAIHQIPAIDAPDGKARADALRAAITQAASARPGSEERSVKAAEAALAIEQMPAARLIVESGVRAHPDSIALSIAEQALLLRSDQTAVALERARALAKRLPENRLALAALAEAQVASSEYAAAIATYESLWAQQPSGPLALALSQARLSGRASDPLKPMMLWLNGHPQDTTVRMGLAAAAQQIGQMERAASEYERLVAQQPRNVVALNNLAWLYYLRSDARALGSARKAYDMAPEIASVADTYGWLLAESGDLRRAIPILRTAAQSAPGMPEIRFHLGAALARQGTAEGRAEARALIADLLLDTRQFEERPKAEKLMSTLTSASAAQ